MRKVDLKKAPWLVGLFKREKCRCRITTMEVPRGLTRDDVALECADDPKCPKTIAMNNAYKNAGTSEVWK